MTEVLSMIEMPSTINDFVTYSKCKPSTLIVIDFNAIWCKPCKEIKPFISYLQENYPTVEFHYIDIQDDTTDTITKHFNISKVPTFVYYKNGVLCNSIIGTDKAKLEESINEYI